MKLRDTLYDSARPHEAPFPVRVDGVGELERLLSEPTTGVKDTLNELDSDVLLLGVNGKLGPSLARMIHRGFEASGLRHRVIGVSRFSHVHQEAEFQARGIETIRCDLLDERAVERLPDIANVVFLAGRKFGATGQESSTWATNCWLPSVVCRKFRRSRIVALSTGNVYGPTPVSSGGSNETDALKPVGEYAMSCVGRERMFEYFSTTLGTPVALVRLNYACDLRYGVLVDLAQKVLSGESVDLSTPYVNTIWQGDVNSSIVECFRHVESPPRVINVTGPELLSVRTVCERFGSMMHRTPRFVGSESNSALLSNPKVAVQLFGKPRVSAEQLLSWVSDWVISGHPTLGKPTGFESRDGRF